MSDSESQRMTNDALRDRVAQAVLGWTDPSVDNAAEQAADAAIVASGLLSEVERLRGLLENVERRQADIRREVKALNVENRRLREEQPDRVRLEKKLVHLKSKLARCEYKCAELTRTATEGADDAR